MKTIRITVSALLAAALLFCSACGTGAGTSAETPVKEEAILDDAVKETKPASVPATIPESDSETETEPQPEPDVDTAPDADDSRPALPYDIKSAVELAGGDAGSVKGSQLITAAAKGSEAVITAYEVDRDGVWSIFESGINGHVGKNGVSGSKTEGDKTTPSGIFDIKRAFGFDDMPDVRLQYTKVNENHYWVDDAASPYYNTMVETDSPTWKSAEHLIEYPANYKMAIVVEYNTENTAAGKGSAIFFHCGDRSTSGCIAADTESVGRILRWLDPECDPQIVIYNAG